ncbi:all trans-polyprenyl-diphosphate synthase PDSS1-like [Diadema antillarum]|uniref:all trans-polyprenyl-diphosphate synthase PDSS1-like n=1 Tax=Diadema antillarum TaxID=105358 RepID=UPI003A87B349
MAALTSLTGVRRLTNICWGLRTIRAVKLEFPNNRGLHSCDSCRLCGSGTHHFLGQKRTVLLRKHASWSSARLSRQWKRGYTTAESDPSTREQTQPHKLIESELQSLHPSIREELSTASPELNEVSQYYFDGKGKSVRPMIVLLMSRVCNIHNSISDRILEPQRQIAMIAEMIHTASLMHDDVIDAADTRRGKMSINELFGQRKSILAGDFVLSISSQALARIGDPDVVIVLSNVIEDLVRGEFMQLGAKDNENERFSHYFLKTYKKTASLMAHSCRAVAMLSGSSRDVCEIAYQYGRNIGMAFQLIDDILDFVSSDDTLGKPTSADLKLGLATAPVLFAAEKFPELNDMIMRRFSAPGDVEKAREAVANTDSIRQSRFLAEQHSREAQRQIERLTDSPERRALVYLTQEVLSRQK